MFVEPRSKETTASPGHPPDCVTIRTVPGRTGGVGCTYSRRNVVTFTANGTYLKIPAWWTGSTHSAPALWLPTCVLSATVKALLQEPSFRGATIAEVPFVASPEPRLKSTRSRDGQSTPENVTLLPIPTELGETTKPGRGTAIRNVGRTVVAARGVEGRVVEAIDAGFEVGLLQPVSEDTKISTTASRLARLRTSPANTSAV